MEDYAGTEEAAETPEERRARKGAELQEAKRTATERYAVIAELIKREACVRKHFEHKSISGLAFSGSREICAVGASLCGAMDHERSGGGRCHFA